MRIYKYTIITLSLLLNINLYADGSNPKIVYKTVTTDELQALIDRAKNSKTTASTQEKVSQDELNSLLDELGIVKDYSNADSVTIIKKDKQTEDTPFFDFNFNFSKKADSKTTYQKYVALSFGLSSVQSEVTNHSGAPVTLNHTLGTSGNSFGAEYGMYVSQNFFATLNYQRMSLSDVDFNNYYASINYDVLDLSVGTWSVGYVAGWSMMTWSNNPVATTTNVDIGSGSLMNGLQSEFDVYLNDKFSFYMAYQYWLMEHFTRIETYTGSAEIKHSFTHNMKIGVKYKF
ncbi:MAG: hypothetical protein GQ570_12045 [Helicobacteraceae bacterium]|nr:hypothetical protein [Helicobacteraceae bacterium]